MRLSKNAFYRFGITLFLCAALTGLGCGGGTSSSSSDAGSTGDTGGTDAGGTDTGDTGGTDTGGTDTATGALSLAVTVTTPTNASLSSPIMKSLVKGRVISEPRYLATPAAGVTVHAEDEAGTQVGESAITNENGEATIPGLTEENLAAGVVIVAETTTTTIHNYEAPETAEIDAAAASGEPIDTTVNAITDIAYAAMQSECLNDLAGCRATVEPKCIRDAMEAMFDEDAEAEADTLNGLAAAMLEAHQVAIVNATAGDVPPADIMRGVLAAEGAADDGLTELTAAVGAETVGDVPLVTAADGFKNLLSKVTESYCELDSTTGESPWREVIDNANAAGETFRPGAMVGMFGEFRPSEITQFDKAYFRDFASAIPEMEGGFALFNDHPEARQSAAESFRLGAFDGGGKGKKALGFLAATFPKVDGNWAFGSAFDPATAAQAGTNGFREFDNGEGGEGEFDPDDIFRNFNGAMSDSDHRRSFAMGGDAAFGGFFDKFFEKNQAGETFNPEDFADFIKSPPGAACETDNDCMPCDSCVNSICNSLSTTMGLSCTDSTGCDDITTCVGGFMAGAGGRCMCASDVATGGFIHDRTGEGPKVFGDATGATGIMWQPPEEGSEGSRCGPESPCDDGLACNHGVCLSGDFKRGSFAACTGNEQCASESCVDGMCAMMSSEQMETFYGNFGPQVMDGGEGGAMGGPSGPSGSGGLMVGSRALGQSCASPMDCASFFCEQGACAQPGEEFEAAFNFEDKKQNGETCATSSECVSFYCVGTCETPVMAGAGGATGATDGPAPGPDGNGGGFAMPTNIPTGAFCMRDAECDSLDCNESSHLCR